MPIIKPSTAFKAGADWVSAEVRSYLSDQVATHVDAVADVRDNDFERTRFVYVRTKAALYRLDLSSGAEDDGDTVLRDNVGRRYVKVAGGDGISIWDAQVDDLAGRAAYDGETAGFKVLVSDTGSGRAALYTMGDGGSGDWSDPAYLTPAAVGGNVVGPATSGDNHLAVYDGTSGILLKDSGKTLPAGAVVGTTDAQTLTDKTLDAADNTVSNLALSMFAAGEIDPDATMAADSDDRVATQRAVVAFVQSATVIDYELVASKSDGITTGGYYLDMSPRGSVRRTVYLAITDGDAGAEVDAHLEVGGVLVYGPFTATLNVPFDVTGLSVAVAAAQPLDLIVETITGTVRGLYFKTTGSPA